MSEGPRGSCLLRADAEPSWLDEVHALLDRLWLVAPEVGGTDRMCFTTALAEVAANIVEHAAREGAVPVRLLVECGDGRLRALFEDSGLPYEQGSECDDELAESGRGLQMARALSDEVSYEREGPVNRWLVVRTCAVA